MDGLGGNSEPSDLWKTLNPISSAIYFCQFCFCAFQLFRIVHYGHKKASYQSYFLMMGLVETTLRVFFYLTYEQEWLPFELHPAVWMFIYWLPLHMQFAMFSLVVLFFAQVVHKNEWEHRYRRYFVGGWLVLNTILLACLILWMLPRFSPASGEVTMESNRARSIVAAVIFMMLAILLAKYGLMLSGMITSSKVQLLATNTTGTQIKTLTVLLVFVFTLRCIFNVIASISPETLDSKVAGGSQSDAIMTFVLVVWELLPIFAITFFFRHIPNPRRVEAARNPLLASNPYMNPYTPGIFQNPNRYDDFGDDVAGSYESNRHSYGSPSRYMPNSHSSGSPIMAHSGPSGHSS